MKGGNPLDRERTGANGEIDAVLAKYADMVYKLALSRTKNVSDAEDIFQEVFLRYITSGTQFESEEHRKAWLLRVTINCGNKLFTSAWSRHRAEYNDEVLTEASPGPEAKDELGITAAVQKLPEAYRIVVHLFYYEDLSIQQICQVLGKKEGTVKSQLNRARALLKKELKEKIE